MLLCTLVAILQHTCSFLQHTCSCTLHTISYIRHFVQKWNLRVPLGRHSYSKYKTHRVIENTKIHTWKYLLTTLNTNQPATKRPQLSHFENFASMDAGRARGRGRGRGGRGRRGHARAIISDDIRATLVDHVINIGLTMREAGQRFHPNLSRCTVSSIIRTFRLENRYVFNSLLSTLLRWYLEYLQYCTISHYRITCIVLQGG